MKTIILLILLGTMGCQTAPSSYNQSASGQIAAPLPTNRPEVVQVAAPPTPPTVPMFDSYGNLYDVPPQNVQKALRGGFQEDGSWTAAWTLASPQQIKAWEERQRAPKPIIQPPTYTNTGDVPKFNSPVKSTTKCYTNVFGQLQCDTY